MSKNKQTVVNAIMDALKPLKEKDIPLTIAIVKRLETLPIVWSPFMKDVDLHGHMEENGYMMINAKAFRDFNPRRRAALLLHEMIHGIAGTELDAESIEQWVFPDVSTAPTTDDRVLFRINEGRFVKLNEETGDVTLKRTGKVIANFQGGRNVYCPLKVDSGLESAGNTT